MIRMKNLSVTLFLGVLFFCGQEGVRAEDSSHSYSHTEYSTERISSKPARNFDGGYVGINVGIFDQNSTLNLNMEGFEITSGASGVQPVGILPGTVNYAVGTYEVAHQVNDIDHERIYAGTHGFVLDGRVGYSCAVSNHGTLGGEVGVIWQGGTSVEFSLVLPASIHATFRNDGGDYLVVNADQQKYLIAQTNAEGESTNMEMNNQLDLQFFIENSALVDILFTCGYAMSPEVLMGVKTGIALGSQTITSELSGEYGSAGYFVDFLSGTTSTRVADTVTWTAPDSSYTLDSSMTHDDVSFVGYVLAPMVEVKMTSALSLLMEAKFILQGEKDMGVFSSTLEGNVVPDDEGNDTMDVSMILDSSNIMMATLGFQYRFGSSS